MVLGYKQVFVAQLLSPLRYEGLLKLETHCTRPERLAPRSCYRVNNPGWILAQLSTEAFQKNS
jgi:hypothetical protein